MEEGKEMERLPWEPETGLTGAEPAGADLTGAESTEVLAFAQYRDLEKAADRTAVKIKEGFLEMGYILKVARDTDILAGSGYISHEEFAEKRYGLDKGTVSRYIRIVERFSVGGNSHVLQEGYKNIGFAKLSLMLHMPDAIAEEITAGYSKQEVQAIKEEVEAERKVSDIELAIEAAEDAQAQEKKPAGLLEQALRQFGRENPDIYRRLHKHSGDIRMILEILAPQGEAIHMVRIPGTGRLMLSLSGDSINVTSVRTWEKERCTPYDVLAAVYEICHHGTVEDSYLQEYGETLEPEPAAGEKKKEGPAPAQPKAKEKRKESKVTKAAPRKKSEAAAVRKPEEVPNPDETGKPEEEQLPGQMEVMDYPEAIPDAHYEELSAEREEHSLEESAGQMKVEESAGSGMPAAESGTMVAESGTPAAGAGDLEDGTAPEAGMKDQAESPENAESTKCGVLQDASFSGETGKDCGEDTVMELQMEAEGHLDCLKQYFTVWDRKPIPVEMLEYAYREAICLASVLHRMIEDGKGVENGEEHHAQ
ncbi:MAG: hypothetical protein HFH88_14835 [Lachnospiraceae bacterium]|jgi:hypothetical protein|nr:hypothetical protein [Lachnospiraceae bacterium]